MGVKGAAPVTEVVHTLISEGQRQDASSGSQDIANTGAFVQQQNMVRLNFYQNFSGGILERRSEGVATKGGMVPSQL